MIRDRIFISLSDQNKTRRGNSSDFSLKWMDLRLRIALYQCKIDQKHHLQALEIVSTIENRIQNQVRHPNRLHFEGNSRFRKPRVTVGQQSFKGKSCNVFQQGDTLLHTLFCNPVELSLF